MVTAPAVVRATSLERDPLKHNFKNFLFKTWMTWFENAPTVRMYEVADFLQYGPDKEVILGFRGLSKSYVTVTYGAWNHYCDPEMLILNLAASGKAAGGNAALYWGMIQGFDWLSHMRPSGIDRAATNAFDVAGSKHEKSESFASMSLFSGDKTGRRADLVLADDVETPNTSATEGDRALLRQHYKELGGAIISGRRGLMKVLGTSQTEHTIYLELAMDKGYAMRIWPLIYPREYRDGEGKLIKEIEKYGPWLSPTIAKELADNPALAGTTTEPTRFSEADIAGFRLEYGTVEFDRQMRLFMDAGVGASKPLHLRDIPVVIIPRPSLSSPLKVPTDVQWMPTPDRKVTDLQVDSLNGDSEMFYPADTQAFREYWQTPDSITMAIDPSGEGKDETAWCIVAQKAGRLFLLHQGARLEGFTSATLEAIAADAKAWGVNKILIEKNYGGGMFSALLRPKLQAISYGATIEDEAVGGGVMKEQRIVDSLETIITDHRLCINLSVLKGDYQVSYTSVEDAKLRYYRLTYQLTRIVRQRGALSHDDRLDALASACRSHMGSLRQVLEQAAQEAKEAFIDGLVRKQIGLLKKTESYGLDDPDFRAGYRLGGTQKVVSMNESPLFRGRRAKKGS